MNGPLEQIRRLVAHGQRNTDLCLAAYRIIEGALAAQRARLLRAFFIGFQFGAMDGSLELPGTVDAAREAALMREYGRAVDRRLYAYMDMGLSEDEFYRRLWDFISSDPLLADLEARAAALFDCAMDSRIPYVYIDPAQPISMEDGEFRERIGALGTELRARLHYCLNTRFAETTQQAAVLVDLLDALPDRVTRAVAMSEVIGHYNKKIARGCYNAGLLSQILSEQAADAGA